VTLLNQLLDKAVECPQKYLVCREDRNYDAFLDLYARVGYAPTILDDMQAWRARSVDTWSHVDSILPGTYTGGFVRDQLESGAGTLPMSPSIVYGHSWCMEKTLDAAFTLYCQALYSLEWMDHFPAASHWAGSYAYGKRFVKHLQREPYTTAIPDQLGFDSLRCSPGARVDTAASKAATLIVEETSTEGIDLPSLTGAVFMHLSAAHPNMKSLHHVRHFVARCSRTHCVRALVLLHEAKPELTAINILDRAWVFPADPIEPAISLAERLQQTQAFCDKRLEIVLEKPVLDSNAIVSEQYVNVFWAFAPRASLPNLRGSFRAAFGSLLGRYPLDELDRLSLSL